MLTATGVAPFVYLESTRYFGVFSDNGFLMLTGSKNITFTTYDSVDDENSFVDGLYVRLESENYVYSS